MPYEFDIQAHEDHIRVEVSGARKAGHEVTDAIQTGRQISDTCREHGITKLLLIFEMTGRLPAIEAYEIFSDPSAFGWTRDIKVALVDMNPESKEDSLFSETVAVNRAYNTRVFEDERDAREWLLNP